MPVQAPRGMKMGSLPCTTLFPCLSGRMGPHRAGAEVVSYWCHELVEALDPDKCLSKINFILIAKSLDDPFNILNQG